MHVKFSFLTGNHERNHGIGYRSQTEILITSYITLSAKVGNRTSGIATEFKKRPPLPHHFLMTFRMRPLESGESVNQSDRGHRVSVSHPSMMIAKGSRKPTGHFAFPARHHEG